jgi:hypothetical protein
MRRAARLATRRRLRNPTHWAVSDVLVNPS